MSLPYSGKVYPTVVFYKEVERPGVEPTQEILMVRPKDGQ